MLRISILDQMNTRAQCIQDDGNELRGPEAYETVKDASRIRMSERRSSLSLGDTKSVAIVSEPPHPGSSRNPVGKAVDEKPQLANGR